jgi:hypothetical protein
MVFAEADHSWTLELNQVCYTISNSKRPTALVSFFETTKPMQLGTRNAIIHLSSVLNGLHLGKALPD